MDDYSDFSLAPAPPAPLDLSAFGQTSTPPFVSPRPTAQPPQTHGERRKLLTLSMFLPLALKAGPGAVQGLLAGFAQHSAQQTQLARQTQQDTRAQQSQDWQQQYQQGQLTNQQQQNQRALLNDFATKVQGLDDPAAIDALTKLYTAQAGSLGLKPEALSAYAQQYTNPSRIQKRAAEKKIAQLKSEYGADKWMEMGAQFTHQLPGSNQPVTFDQLLALAGQAKDPAYVAPPPKVSAPNTTEEAAIADAIALAEERKGAKLTRQEIAKARLDAVAEFARIRGTADDRPRTEPRTRYNVQQITNADGTTGLVRLNLDTGDVSPVALPGSGAGKVSDTERLSKAYYDRTAASNTTAETFEQQLASLGSQFDVKLPTLLQSESGQRYKQAKDEFINASLRRESGAAIQPSEYARYDKIYFVQPGDTPATVKQKQAARKRVIAGFKVTSGNLGADPRPASGPVAAPGPNPFRRGQ